MKTKSCSCIKRVSQKMLYFFYNLKLLEPMFIICSTHYPENCSF